MSEDLKKDLEAIALKHGIKDMACCGTVEEKDGPVFLGFLVTHGTAIELIETTFNVGRLWQHARGEVRRMLNDFEREKGWPSR